jgi:hypothetical protein
MPFKKICRPFGKGWRAVKYSVEVLCRKPECRGFDSLWVHRVFFFKFASTFQLHYGSGVDSATNRIEYQKFSGGVKCWQLMRLTASPPYVNWVSRKMWYPRHLTILWVCYRDSFTFSLLPSLLNRDQILKSFCKGLFAVLSIQSLHAIWLSKVHYIIYKEAVRPI